MVWSILLIDISQAQLRLALLSMQNIPAYNINAWFWIFINIKYVAIMIIEIKERDVVIVSAKLIYIFRQVLLGFKTQKLTVPGTVFFKAVLARH